MGIAVYHLCSLLVASWSNLVSALGTTTLAICVAIGIFILSVLRSVGRQGLAAMTTYFRQTAKDGLILTIIVWLMLYGGSFVWTVYQDHQQLVQQATKLRHDLTTTKANYQQQLAALQQDRPNFRLSLQQGIVNFQPQERMTLLLIQVTITNLGAPSAPMGWNVRCVSQSGTSEHALLVAIENQPVFHLEGQRAGIRFDSHQDILMRTTAIPKGESATGFLTVGISGNKTNDINNGSYDFFITVHDYLGGAYTGRWRSGGSTTQINVLPGETFVRPRQHHH